MTAPDLKMSCRQLARLTGISPTTASRVLKGDKLYDSETIAAVYKATGHCIACGSTRTPLAEAVAVPEVAALVEAAEAVVQRWDSQDWKSGHTLDFITRLRHAAAALRGIGGGND